MYTTIAEVAEDDERGDHARGSRARSGGIEALEVRGPRVHDQEPHQECGEQAVDRVVEEPDRQEAEHEGSRARPEPEVLVQQVERERREREKRLLHGVTGPVVDPSLRLPRRQARGSTSAPGRSQNSVSRSRAFKGVNMPPLAAPLSRSPSRSPCFPTCAPPRPAGRAGAARCATRSRPRPVSRASGRPAARRSRGRRAGWARASRASPWWTTASTRWATATARSTCWRSTRRTARSSGRAASGRSGATRYGGPRGTPSVDGGMVVRARHRGRPRRGRRGVGQGSLAPQPARATSAVE